MIDRMGARLTIPKRRPEDRSPPISFHFRIANICFDSGVSAASNYILAFCSFASSLSAVPPCWMSVPAPAIVLQPTSAPTRPAENSIANIDTRILLIIWISLWVCPLGLQPIVSRLLLHDHCFSSSRCDLFDGTHSGAQIRSTEHDEQGVSRQADSSSYSAQSTKCVDFAQNSKCVDLVRRSKLELLGTTSTCDG